MEHKDTTKKRHTQAYMRTLGHFLPKSQIVLSKSQIGALFNAKFYPPPYWLGRQSLTRLKARRKVS